MMCEKCWANAYNGGYGDQVNRYRELILERKANPCSPRDQAGQWWDEATQTDSRQPAKKPPPIAPET